MQQDGLNKVARLMRKNGIHAHFSNHQKKPKHLEAM
jgi:hypothetical protein